MSTNTSKRAAVTVFTIGHSTRPIEELLELLHKNKIEVLVDIRSIPGSRKNPQFSQKNLSDSLAKAGLEYRHMPSLGGRRRAKADSINTGWRSDSFRAYADYMLTDDFHAALDDLMKLAAQTRVAIMCAEAVPWRCHRFLVSDALLTAGAHVKHIISTAVPQDHKLCSFAHIEGSQIIYS